MDLDEEIENRRALQFEAKKAGKEWLKAYYQGAIELLENLKENTYGPDTEKTQYPQAQESNEYRYVDADWLDNIAAGLTDGANKYGEGNWRSIPAEEHAARAMRHLNLYRAGDQRDDHLINASMRCMMAYVVDRNISK